MTASNQTQQTPDDGGPAFPWGEYGTHLGGMTLRDYFAAKAMQELLASGLRVAETGDAETSLKTLKLVCSSAYGMADEMLKARTTP